MVEFGVLGLKVVFFNFEDEKTKWREKKVKMENLKHIKRDVNTRGKYLRHILNTSQFGQSLSYCTSRPKHVNLQTPKNWPYSYMLGLIVVILDVLDLVYFIESLFTKP